MNTMILVSALIVTALSILTYVALHRGWFRLAPPTAETKVHFVLMRKKTLILEEDKKALPMSTNMQPSNRNI